MYFSRPLRHWQYSTAMYAWGPSAMLTISGGQLYNHWFSLEFGYKWACKTIEFITKIAKTKLVKCMKNWSMIGFVILTGQVFSLFSFRTILLFYIVIFNFPLSESWFCTLFIGKKYGSWFEHQRVLLMVRILALICSHVIRHSLQWRHNGHDSVSNHQPHDCLLNRLFRRRSKKTSKLRVTGLCAGNSPVTGEFPTQRASNAEKSFHLMTSSCLPIAFRIAFLSIGESYTGSPQCQCRNANNMGKVIVHKN